MGAGACLALSTGLLALLYVHTTSDVRSAPLSAEFLLARVGETLLLALIVSLLEESFFRVIILRGLARDWPAAVAIGGSALVYAFVHFLTPDKSYVYPGY